MDQFEIVELQVMEYSGLRGRLKPAFAIGFNGQVVIDARTGCADWSYDRAEIEQTLLKMTQNDEA